MDNLDFKPDMIEEIYHLYINGKIKLKKSQKEIISRLWHELNSEIKGM